MRKIRSTEQIHAAIMEAGEKYLENKRNGVKGSFARLYVKPFNIRAIKKRLYIDLWEGRITWEQFLDESNKRSINRGIRTPYVVQKSINLRKYKESLCDNVMRAAIYAFKATNTTNFRSGKYMLVLTELEGEDNKNNNENKSE